MSVEKERRRAMALAAWNSEEQIHTQVITSCSQLQVRLHDRKTNERIRVKINDLHKLYRKNGSYPFKAPEVKF